MNMPIKGGYQSHQSSVIMEVAYKGQKLYLRRRLGGGYFASCGNSNYDFIKLSHHGSVRNLQKSGVER